MGAFLSLRPGRPGRPGRRPVTGTVIRPPVEGACRRCFLVHGRTVEVRHIESARWGRWTRCPACGYESAVQTTAKRSGPPPIPTVPRTGAAPACSVEWCGEPSRARGLCPWHYRDQQAGRQFRHFPDGPPRGHRRAGKREDGSRAARVGSEAAGATTAATAGRVPNAGPGHPWRNRPAVRETEAGSVIPGRRRRGSELSDLLDSWQ